MWGEVRMLEQGVKREKPVILIVDDSTTIVKGATLFLGDDYDIKFCNNGYDALASVVRNRPDVIFLDVVMPRLDGHKVCMALRSNPEYADLPIVMLSSKDSVFDRARGLMMGCNDYLSKPFTKDELLSAIAKFVPDSKAARDLGGA